MTAGMQIYFLILYFFTYGILGWCVEVAFAAAKEGRFVNRGFLNGPICPIYGIGVSVVIQFLTPLENHLVALYLASTVLVTVIEGVTGFMMDRIFHHKWWDYSGQPLNIGGYICLLFSLVWGVGCVLIVKLVHPVIYKALAWIPTLVGIVLLCVLGAVLLADLCVTASGILKLNRRLEAMERIAAELHELSDKLGANISENVMEGMERQEEGKKKLEEAVDELKEKYNSLAEQRTKVTSRLLKAFPKMESRKHKDILEELKKFAKKGRD